jgi:hypothetical protein
VEPSQIASITRSLKGAPAICLIAMQLLNRRTGREELTMLTGYSEKPITKALRLLEVYRLTYNDRRYQGWQLTDLGRQLPLFIKSLGESLGEGEIPSPGSSSSKESILIDSRSCVRTHKESLKQLQLQIEGEIPSPALPDNPAFTRLTDLLIKRCGTAPAKAKEAISQALKSGDEPSTLIYDILTWLAYCQSEQGRGSKPATLIPARIREGIPPPEFFQAPIGVELEIQRLQGEFLYD